MENLIIRKETSTDYREVENLVREAFRNVYRPGCMEHYVSASAFNFMRCKKLLKLKNNSFCSYLLKNIDYSTKFIYNIINYNLWRFVYEKSIFNNDMYAYSAQRLRQSRRRKAD